MTNNRLSPRPWRTTAVKVALVYMLVASLWIAFSDHLLAGLGLSVTELSHWQTAKGWLFVLATGGLLFIYLNRCLRRQHDTFGELTTLFDSIPAVVYVADMQSYDLLFVNRFAGESFGSDWQSRKCYDYLQQGQQQPCAFCTNHLLLRDGQPGPPVTWEFRNTRSGRWYQCLDKAVRWPDGRLVRLEIALDITERKELERTKEELLSAVSHEMRTPLTAIAGFSELLLDSQTLSEPVRRHVETIFREAGKMQELIHTFLEVRRLKTDQARIDYEWLSARNLFEQACKNDTECTSRHQLTIDCPEDLAVFGNRRELVQIFRQLISNACRFSPAGGDITLQGRTDGDFVKLCIVDQGIGIPLEEQERIFEPFYRLDIGDRRQVRGIGLGLAMVREIVHLHGGTVSIESVLGKGSRFTVSLPGHAPVAIAGKQGLAT
jgi:signal transduction histidine kinase